MVASASASWHMYLSWRRYRVFGRAIMCFFFPCFSHDLLGLEEPFREIILIHGPRKYSLSPADTRHETANDPRACCDCLSPGFPRKAAKNFIRPKSPPPLCIPAGCSPPSPFLPSRGEEDDFDKFFAQLPSLLSRSANTNLTGDPRSGSPPLPRGKEKETEAERRTDVRLDPRYVCRYFSSNAPRGDPRGDSINVGRLMDLSLSARDKINGRFTRIDFWMIIEGFIIGCPT